MRKLTWGAWFVVVASCGGVSIEEPNDEGTGGTSGDGATGAGGSPVDGGASAGVGRGGQPGKGGVPSRGGTPGYGGFPGKGGTTPFGGTVGIGGTAGIGGADDGGAGDGGDTGPGGVAGCMFAPITKGYRCENAGSRVQDTTSERVVGATSVEECEEACLARSDCTAVTDYFSEPGLSRCYLWHGTCASVGVDIAAEEDASKNWRKVCPSTGQCYLEYLGNWNSCRDSGTAAVLMGATSRADCDRACLADSSCGGVIDYFWIAQIVGCYLYTSTCNSPEPLPYGDPGRTYRKICQ